MAKRPNYPEAPEFNKTRVRKANARKGKDPSPKGKSPHPKLSKRK